MRTIGVLVLTLACAMPVMARADADPLAQAREGQFQCYVSDLARKTCRALAHYEFGPDGRITNPALVLVAPEPITIMAVTSQVAVKDGAVCGVASPADIDKAAIAVAGQPLSADQTGALKARIKAAMAGRMGKEICTAYRPDGDRYTAQVTVDGAPAPELTAEVVWVRPDQGFTVAP